VVANPKPFQLDERRSFRFGIEIEARLIGPDGMAMPFLVQNLSRHGASGEWAGGDLVRGTAVALLFPDLGRFAAHIVWAEKDRLGVEFVAPLPPPALDRLLEEDPDAISSHRVSPKA